LIGELALDRDAAIAMPGCGPAGELVFGLCGEVDLAKAPLSVDFESHFQL
jgi:hypothetical protein